MKEKKIPLRMCIGCREMKPKRELIRVVRLPEGQVSLDSTGRMPGRGAYICKNRECLMRAIKQKQIEKTFSCALPEETAAQLTKALDELNEQHE